MPRRKSFATASFPGRFSPEHRQSPEREEEQNHHDPQGDRPVEPGIAHPTFPGFLLDLFLALVFFAVYFPQTKLHVAVRAECILVQHVAWNFQLMSLWAIDVEHLGFVINCILNRWFIGSSQRNPDFRFRRYFFLDCHVTLDRGFHEIRLRWHHGTGDQESFTTGWTLARLSNIRLVSSQHVSLRTLKLKYHLFYLPHLGHA
jgi:hypothetical protein